MKELKRKPMKSRVNQFNSKRITKSKMLMKNQNIRKKIIKKKLLQTKRK